MTEAADVPSLNCPDAIVVNPIDILIDNLAEPHPQLRHLLVRQVALEDALFHANAVVRTDLRHSAQAVRTSNVVGDQMQYGYAAR